MISPEHLAHSRRITTQSLRLFVYVFIYIFQWTLASITYGGPMGRVLCSLLITQET